MIQAAVPAANFHAIVYFHDESLRQVYTKVLLRASRINNVNINSCTVLVFIYVVYGFCRKVFSDDCCGAVGVPCFGVYSETPISSSSSSSSSSVSLFGSIIDCFLYTLRL